MVDPILYYLAQLFSLKGLKFVVAFLIMNIGEFLGNLDVTIYALLILMTMDVVLGLSQAYRNERFSSTRLKEGLYKFILYGFAIMAGHFTDIIVFHREVEYGFDNFIVVYLGVSETLSIIKHLTYFGIKFPLKLIQSLESFRDPESVNKKI